MIAVHHAPPPAAVIHAVRPHATVAPSPTARRFIFTYRLVNGRVVCGRG